MHEALTAYYAGERNGGLLLAGLGLIGLATAALFWDARWGLRSFAVTLGIAAIIEIAIGVGLYLRAGPLVNHLVAQLGSDVARVVAEEGARMARVQRSFVVGFYVEVAVIVLAAIAALGLKGRVGVSGIVLGVLLNVALLFAFDLVAERRGAAYLAAIEAQRPTGREPRR